MNANGVTNIWRMYLYVNGYGYGWGQSYLTNLTQASSLNPVWSTDGANIAFVSPRALDLTDSLNPNATLNIWKMAPNGTGLTAVTNLSASSADSWAPAWSPDSAKLVFTSKRNLNGADAANNTPNIWVANSNGSGTSPLTTLTVPYASNPVWSPDSAMIAYVSDRALNGTDGFNTHIGGTYATTNVWVMHADGSFIFPLTNLTAPGADSRYPSWSPDGLKIAYSSARRLDGTDNAGDFNVWIMNSGDGAAAAPLTNLTAAGGAGSVSGLVAGRKEDRISVKPVPRR